MRRSFGNRTASAVAALLRPWSGLPSWRNRSFVCMPSKEKEIPFGAGNKRHDRCSMPHRLITEASLQEITTRDKEISDPSTDTQATVFLDRTVLFERNTVTSSTAKSRGASNMHAPRHMDVSGTALLAVDSAISMQSRTLGEFRCSWRVLCVGILGLPLSLMPSSAIGVFIAPLANSFGWSLSSISGLAGFMGLGAILAGPLEGRLIDRFGFRPVVLAYIPMLAAAVASTSLVGEDIWTLYLAMFFWGCVGSGSVANYVRAISGWFKVGRGKAIGLMFTAGGIGCTIGPRLAQWAIDHYGWQIGYLVLAAVVLLAWPLAFLWLHNKKDAETTTNRKVTTPEAGHTRREAFTTGIFWYISAAWLLSGLTAGGVFFLVPFLIDHNVSREAAASYLSILFAASAVVHPVLGFINDRWYPPFIAAFAFLLKASAFVLLGLFGSRYAVLAAVLVGVGMSGLSNSFFSCIPRYFGLRSFGEIAGLIQSAGSAAAMLGPLIFSSLQEESGSYKVSYVTVGIIAVCAAGCMTMAGRMMAARHPLPWTAQA